MNPEKNSLVIGVPVWGEKYVDIFLRFSLPSQLASGNIPYIKKHIQKYFIYTTLIDQKRILKSNVFVSLSKHLEVEFVLLDTELDLITSQNYNLGKYHLKSKCYRNLLKIAAENNSIALLLNADMYLSSSFISDAIKIFDSDAEVEVLQVLGPRTNLEDFEAALSTKCNDNSTDFDLSAQELSSIWLSCIHPAIRQHYVRDRKSGNFHPSNLYWTTNADEYVVVRGFHLYPIMVKSKIPDLKFNDTIDQDLVSNMAQAKSRTFTVQNSCDIFCCELSSKTLKTESPIRLGTNWELVKFYDNSGKNNFVNLYKPITIHRKTSLGELREVEISELFIHKLDVYRKIFNVISWFKPNKSKKVNEFIKLIFAVVLNLEKMDIIVKLFRLTLDHGAAQNLYKNWRSIFGTFPLGLEERILYLDLNFDPKRPDLISRLKHVIELQGKEVPSDIQFKFNNFVADWPLSQRAP